MRTTRTIAWVFLLCLPIGCGERTPPPEHPEIDAALDRAAAFLVSQEVAGVWPSSTYGLYRDGVALTPHVLSALIVLAPEHPATRHGLDELRAWVARGFQDQLAELDRLDLPVYTLAAASWCVGLTGDAETQRHYLDRLLDHPLNERRGWTPDDPGYGGFGDGPRPSIKGDGPPPTANLSATLYAVAAARFAGRLDPPTRDAALAFARSCHNRVNAEDPTGVADGGFFFSPTDPHRNKAGLLDGRPRSYAGPTADGVRLLLVCGVAPDDPEVVEAREWLLENFDPARVAGGFNPDREPLRESYYFYTVWSVAHALHRLGVPPEVWAQPLADELLARQRDDGSWANRYTDGHEDDPLVATPLASGALAVCREALAAALP